MKTCSSWVFCCWVFSCVWFFLCRPVGSVGGLDYYYINMNTSTRRNEAMKLRFRDENLTRIEALYPAVLPQILWPQTRGQTTIETTNACFEKKKDLKLYPSHLKAIGTAYEHHLNLVLILEDDAVASDQSEKDWSELLVAVRQEIPDWEILELFTFSCRCLRIGNTTVHEKLRGCAS